MALILLLVSSVGACDSKAQERQQITDYIDSMLPVMEAHSDWHEDQNAFAQSRNLDYDEATAELADLIRRMEEIYMDVETSIPPTVLREFKHKWSQVCQLELQLLAVFIEALETSNTSLPREINELTFQANDIKTEVDEELLDILHEYDIDISE